MRFHTSLPVRDIERTIQFYSALFGKPPVKQRTDYAKFLPGTPDINLTFHQSESPSVFLKDLHLGFEFADAAELDAAHERMQAAGWISESRNTSVCCYASQDKFWINDPDGYRWEIYRLLADTEHSRDETSGCCAKPTGATTPACC